MKAFILVILLSFLFIEGGEMVLSPHEKFERKLCAFYDEYESHFGIRNEKQMADEPAAAAWQNFLMTFDPELNRVPLERLENALQQIKSSGFYRSGSQLTWNEIPSNMGGRVRAMMIDPNEGSGKKIWAGSVTGGLWYNNNIIDSNSMWYVADGFQENLSVSAICYDPNHPSTFYVGTGEPFTARIIYRESSGRGSGIFKSSDGGKTWFKLPSTKDFAYISDIVVRNENGNSVVYAAVVSGFYQGQTHQSLPEDGLYRSEDGGASWTQVLPDIKGEKEPYAVSDIEITAGNRLIAGTMKNMKSKGGAVILWSDAGTPGSWTVIDSFQKMIEATPELNVPGRVMLAAAPSNANTVYALIGSGYFTPEGFNYSYCKHILRSNDGGKSWQQKNLPNVSGNGFATIAWHALTVEVDPLNANTVYIGGLDVHRSVNGGNSWVKMSDWAKMYTLGGDDFVHADIHQFLYLGTGGKMLISTDGGIFYTEDANSTTPVFYPRNRGFNSLQFYTCDIHPQRNEYAGGLQDNGSLWFTGKAFSLRDMINGGDGAYCFFDKDYPDMLITSFYYNRYQFTDNGQFYANAGIQSGTFISPADYASADNILIANAVTFAGDNIDKLLTIDANDNPPVSLIINANTGSSAIFSAVKICPSYKDNNPDVLVGTLSGRLFKIEKILTSAKAKEIGSPSFPTANISGIATGTTDDTILITISNYGVSSVWLTFDQGKTWKAIEGNLPDIPVRWGILHPKNSLQAMLATETGIWTCDNISAAAPEWTLQSNTIPNVRVDMLQVRKSDNKVIAATHGRGLWTCVWPVEERPLKASFIANKQQITAGDSLLFTDISEGNPISWQWNFEGGTPSQWTGKTPPYIHYPIPGSFSVSLAVADQQGNSDTMNKTAFIEVLNSITEQISPKSFVLFPNPANKELTINKSKGIFSVEIFDLYGRLWLSEKLQNKAQNTISTELLPEGTFLVRINRDNHCVMKINVIH